MPSQGSNIQEPTTINGNTDRPVDVGIVDMELYIPHLYVDQSELEEHDLKDTAAEGGEAWNPGKYTDGLGQTAMSFVADREDVSSICMTALYRLMKRRSLKPSDIGSLEVGTETLLDRAKSIKTSLMQLLEGNSDVNGVDTHNACFGGAQALFNAVNWVESSSWDGRYAVVVTGDIAVHKERHKRCTGGAGGMAILVGTNAALVFDQGLRVFHMGHSYDYYMPNMHSEYPVVDSALTIRNYLETLKHCLEAFAEKHRSRYGQFDVTNFDGLLFQTPYCKLIQKTVAVIALLSEDALPNGLEELREAMIKSKLDCKFFEKVYHVSNSMFESRAQPGLLLTKQVGNLYNSSLFVCLVSHILFNKNTVPGSRMLLFPYGSGISSAMFSVTASTASNRLANLRSNLQSALTGIETRRKVSPENYNAIMDQRETYYSKAPYSPSSSLHDVASSAYYLDRVDESFRRYYKLKSS